MVRFDIHREQKMQANVRLFLRICPNKSVHFLGFNKKTPKILHHFDSIFFCDGDEIDDDDLEGNSTIVGVKQFVLDWMEDRTIL